MFSLLFIFTYPVLIFLIKKRVFFLKNLYKVIKGEYTWVGYDESNGVNKKLPRINSGILPITSGIDLTKLKGKDISRINLIYAKNYEPITDIKKIFNNIRKLGN